MAEQKRFRLNNPEVVAEAIEGADIADGEAIILNLATGTYYSVRGDGILIWNAVVAGASCEEISAAVVEQTGAERDAARSAIGSFLQSLAAEGLIVEQAGDLEERPALLDLAGGGDGLLEPRFEVYTDMRDLILLDPVHQVDERGWPNVHAAS
jgi:Coenzyme PQQ synthesis protein D (PqqD)